MVKHYRMSGFFNIRKNGRFLVSSHRKTFGLSLKRGFLSKKDFNFLYEFFKGKGF